MKASQNQDAFFKFVNAMQQAPWIAQNFITNGRPLFNEKAYKILVNQGTATAPGGCSTTSRRRR